MQLNRDNTESVFAGEDEPSIGNGFEEVSQEERTMSLLPTISETPTPSLPLEPLPERYTVQDGDTLNSISVRFYGTSDMVSRIMEYNGITDPNVIVTGRTIELPSH
jgi:LysM repeat protein